jgi:hypothetical protein
VVGKIEKTSCSFIWRFLLAAVFWLAKVVHGKPFEGNLKEESRKNLREIRRVKESRLAKTFD